MPVLAYSIAFIFFRESITFAVSCSLPVLDEK